MWPIFTAGQFTEDGSFIGQYVPGKLQPPVSPQLTNNASPILYTSAPAANAAVKAQPSPPPALGAGQAAAVAAMNQTTASTGTNTNPSATYV